MMTQSEDNGRFEVIDGILVDKVNELALDPANKTVMSKAGSKITSSTLLLNLRQLRRESAVFFADIQHAKEFTRKSEVLISIREKSDGNYEYTKKKYTNNGWMFLKAIQITLPNSQKLFIVHTVNHAGFPPKVDMLEFKELGPRSTNSAYTLFFGPRSMNAASKAVLNLLNASSLKDKCVKVMQDLHRMAHLDNHQYSVQTSSIAGLESSVRFLKKSTLADQGRYCFHFVSTLANHKEINCIRLDPPGKTAALLDQFHATVSNPSEFKKLIVILVKEAPSFFNAVFAASLMDPTHSDPGRYREHWLSRKIINSIKNLIRFCFVDDDDFDSYASEDGKVFKYLSTAYSRISAEESVVRAFDCVLINSTTVSVNNAIISCQHIQQNLNNLNTEFDKCFSSLSNLLQNKFSLQHIFDVFASNCYEETSGKSICETFYQLLSFPGLFLKIWCTESATMALKLIDSLTAILAILAYIEIGAYRFSEILNLQFAGQERSIYFYPATKQLYVLAGYKKTKKTYPSVRFFSLDTSMKIVALIVALRPLYISCLLTVNPTLPLVSLDEDIFMESAFDDNLSDSSESGDAELSILLNTFYKTFLFPTKNGTLVSRKVASNLMSCCGFRIFRQVFSALNEQLMEDLDVETRETVRGILSTAEGHHPSTKNSLYGSTNNRGSLFGVHRMLSNQWLRLIGYQKIVEETKQEVKKQNFPIADDLDSISLVSAGKQLFGDDFAFRSVSQFQVTVDILYATTSCIAVNAPTGFGKTLCYQIPIHLYKDIATNFVITPYTALKVDVLNRVSASVPYSDNHAQLAGYNTIVGNFDVFNNAEFYNYLVNFPQFNPSKFLNLLIIDEAHLYTSEREFRNLPKDLSILKKIFRKIIFLSATMPETTLIELRKVFNIKSKVTTHRLITEVPTAHFAFYKQIQGSLDSAKDATLSIIEQSKDKRTIILFFRYKNTIPEFEEFFTKKNIDYTTITGDLSTEEKRTRIDLVREKDAAEEFNLIFATSILTVGVDFQNCYEVVFIEQLFDIATTIQAMGRCRKRGSIYFMPLQRNACKELDVIAVNDCIVGQVAKFYCLEHKCSDMCREGQRKRPAELEPCESLSSEWSDLDDSGYEDAPTVTQPTVSDTIESRKSEWIANIKRAAEKDLFSWAETEVPYGRALANHYSLISNAYKKRNYCGKCFRKSCPIKKCDFKQIIHFCLTMCYSHGCYPEEYSDACSYIAAVITQQLGDELLTFTMLYHTQLEKRKPQKLQKVTGWEPPYRKNLNKVYDYYVGYLKENLLDPFHTVVFKNLQIKWDKNIVTGREAIKQSFNSAKAANVHFMLYDNIMAEYLANVKWAKGRCFNCLMNHSIGTCESPKNQILLFIYYITMVAEEFHLVVETMFPILLDINCFDKMVKKLCERYHGIPLACYVLVWFSESVLDLEYDPSMGG